MRNDEDTTEASCPECLGLGFVHDYRGFPKQKVKCVCDTCEGEGYVELKKPNYDDYLEDLGDAS